jgi:threonyl-tRNA synthetase
MMKIPYILVCGGKEEKAGTVAVRTRGKKKLDFGVKVDTFIKDVREQIDNRELKP